MPEVNRHPGEESFTSTTAQAAQAEADAARAEVPTARATHGPITSSPHSLRNRLGRVLWGVCYAVLVRPSPRPFFGWRRFWYRLFGARLAGTARIYPRARVWAPWNLRLGDLATLGDGAEVYCVAPVTLHDRAAISQYVYLCAATHDYRDPGLPLVPLPITLEHDVWVAADVFVGPGVTIGAGTVVGARSSVFNDLPAWSVCVGAPARAVKRRSFTTETPRH